MVWKRSHLVPCHGGCIEGAVVPCHGGSRGPRRRLRDTSEPRRILCSAGVQRACRGARTRAAIDQCRQTPGAPGVCEAERRRDNASLRGPAHQAEKVESGSRMPLGTSVSSNMLPRCAPYMSWILPHCACSETTSAIRGCGRAGQRRQAGPRHARLARVAHTAANTRSQR
jgi:hypothetical protein